jgi:hypothetical protein
MGKRLFNAIKQSPEQEMLGSVQEGLFSALFLPRWWPRSFPSLRFEGSQWQSFRPLVLDIEGLIPFRK